MNAKYDRLPEDAREDARDYVEHREAPGGFLMAVLTNNLVDAFALADPTNREALADWALWLWNDIPRECWGSRDKVERWLYHPQIAVPAGLIPAHEPGSYPRLACCAGIRPLVETVTRTPPTVGAPAT